MDQAELLFQVVNKLYEHREKEYYCHVEMLLEEIGQDWQYSQQILEELHDKKYIKPWPDDRERFKISDAGIKYLQIEKSKRRIMNQKEMLDLILRKLYEYRDDGNFHSTEAIMQELGIFDNLIESARLAKRLHEDGLARGTFYGFNQSDLKISSHGVDYCEETSYVKPGTSLVSNHYYFSGAGTNFIKESSGFTINQRFEASTKALDLLEQLKAKVDEEQILESLKKDIQECANEIIVKVNNDQKVPDFFIEKLTSYGANVASIGGLAIQIGQVLGYIPK